MLERKIKTIPQLRVILSRLKRKGKRVVFTNGCFDILHYGHVNYLEQARRKGDCLVVALNSDTSVRKLKGHKRPVVNEHDRLRVIAALESVDYVTLFGEATPLAVITALMPDVLVKGGDWARDRIVGADFVTRHGGRVCTVPLAKGRSTTSLIKKIARSC